MLAVNTSFTSGPYFETVENEWDVPMLLIDSLSYEDGSRPFYTASRARPRVSLGTGIRIGHTINPPLDASPSEVLQAACGLALSTGLDVSLTVRGELARVPALAMGALGYAGLPPHRLELAMSAGQLRSASVETLVALSELRDVGVSLALHDFGRGTLDLVRKLPLSAVILTPSTIRDLPGSPERLALLHALVGLAHGNGLTLIATGVETEAQRALLSGLGCDIGEGDLFGPSMLHHDRR